MITRQEIIDFCFEDKSYFETTTDFECLQLMCEIYAQQNLCLIITQEVVR